MALRDQLTGYAAGASHALVDDDERPIDVEAEKPTEAELEQHVAAPGRKAPIPLGVLYQGPWRKLSDGMARHVREQAMALSQYAPVNLSGIGPSSIFDHEMEPEVINAVGYLQNIHCQKYACSIRQLVFNSVDVLLNTILPGGARLAGQRWEEAVLASTIVYTSWERDRVHDAMVELLRAVGEVWVPCEANREAFVTSGLDAGKVKVVPYPYEPTTHLATQIPVPRGSESVPDGKRFYTIGKWEPRKEQDRLLGAFLRAFTPRDRACLTIKTFGWGRWSGYPSPEEAGRRWASDPEVKARGWTQKALAQRIRVIDDELTDAEIAALHRENNIYVSPSHGEAWDIPAFDARCAGNSLVWVPYSGANEYTVADDKQFVAVPWRYGPCHEGYGWEKGACWAEYELQDLVEALRKVQPPELRHHPREFGLRFSRHAVGRLMMDRVLAVVGRTQPELADELKLAGSFG